MTRSRPSLAAAALVVLTLLIATRGAAAAGDDLERSFRTVPDAAKPSCYWWWFNSLMDKAGVTRDLQEFKAKGMGAVTIVWSTSGGFGGGPIPEGPAFLSPEWRELYAFALHEADRLGLAVGVNVCGGWCMGGPWITPEHAGRWFLQSELTLTGPQAFAGTLPLPNPRSGYDSPPQLNVGGYIGLPLDQVDYRDTAVVAFRAPALAASAGPARTDLAAKSNRLDGTCFLPARLAMDQTLAAWTAAPADQPIAPGAVIDLTGKLGPDGKLTWEVPAGTWTIVRTGHRMTGQHVSLPAHGSDGLEVDWFSAAAVDQQWEHLIKILIDDAGPLAGKTLTYLFSESFEDGYPNWTATMLERFQHYRGYDPTPYLPVFTGRLVGSAEISERFLHDYRKTVADCMADNHYGHLAELARARGLDTACEAAGPSWSGTMCMDGLKNLGRCAMPMGEFWQDLFVVAGQNQVGKQTACAAHIYGHRTASAESFTSFQPPWSQSPESLKPIVDRAFCEGINRCVFHTMTGTRPQDGQPGYEYGAGTHFNVNVTWWQQAATPWIGYIARCQALLQSGLFVADALFYNGDGAPNLVEPKHVDPGLGKGYDYDVCNAEVLLTRLAVEDGRLVLPDGMSYRLLVLPARDRMPVAVARKIKELVAAGATVIGPRPVADPGLQDYPRCDAEVRSLAAETWGDCDGQTVKRRAFGKGRVAWGVTPREVLLDDQVLPDFEHSGGDGAFIDFIHRRSGDTEVYFLANRNQRAEHLACTFRVGGRQPELWDPVTGTTRDATVSTQADSRTTVPLDFAPSGSLFVVFRKPLGAAAPVAAVTSKPIAERVVRELAAPWTVQFDQQWFYPTAGLTGDQAAGKLVFATLDDWSKRPEDAVRHFSGTATYRAGFDAAPVRAGARVALRLGVVANGTARVRLNGKDLGVLWCEPWRIDVTGALAPGANQLEIEVVNLWPNRLIGDAGLPADQRRTRTNINTYKSDSALLSSGLLGPVTLETTDGTTN